MRQSLERHRDSEARTLKRRLEPKAEPGLPVQPQHCAGYCELRLRLVTGLLVAKLTENPAAAFKVPAGSTGAGDRGGTCMAKCGLAIGIKYNGHCDRAYLF